MRNSELEEYLVTVNTDSDNPGPEITLDMVTEEFRALLDKYPQAIPDLYLRMKLGYFDGEYYDYSRDQLRNEIGDSLASVYTRVFKGNCGCIYGSIGSILNNLDNVSFNPYHELIRLSRSGSMYDYSPLERFVMHVPFGATPADNVALAYLTEYMEQYASAHDIQLPSPEQLAQAKHEIGDEYDV